ncbi:uncharacterized protein MCYG_02633 [Microsporum canis CBS 113480]|uniref:Uncharacterized protein n=1 Tax=Arthroderma otae (strain ATCC MYA-4605 / CBS 113480) TaxID=554155 RepID=C5FGC9_ARTOC|nr:uncharacterized protein MCYG_02633 [Microsporum canis CBS 113480]EEQ29814.1 predicted protein [Microsporum canis CBS 113480]
MPSSRLYVYMNGVVALALSDLAKRQPGGFKSDNISKHSTCVDTGGRYIVRNLHYTKSQPTNMAGKDMDRQPQATVKGFSVRIWMWQRKLTEPIRRSRVTE